MNCFPEKVRGFYVVSTGAWSRSEGDGALGGG